MDIAIDLGTSNTRIFIDGKGVSFDAPSVVTYEEDTQEVLAVGHDAFSMLGRTPPGLKAVYPLACGVIAESYLVEDMVNIFLKKVSTSKVVMPRVVACIPGDITEVERRAVVNAISSFGVRRVYLIEAAKAAAMGNDMPVMNPYGCMIADIGGGTADIAVTSLGGISVSKSVKIAGNFMDEEIVKYVRRKYNLCIGSAMAEQCKIKIGCLKKPETEKTFRLKGRHLVKGLPRYVDIKSSEIMEAIEETAITITKGILNVLEETPPELIGDIYNDGITISGGLSQLYGFDTLISEHTGMKVNVAEEPHHCVIKGCGKAIAYIEEVEHLSDGEINPLIAVY